MSLDINVLKTITVLYVEDDYLIREQTKAMFQNLFKETITASDGKEGLEAYLANKDKIDVIVSDINMPNMDGLEMSEEIHKIDPNVPIVITTAFTDENYLLKSLEIDVSKYVTKPLKVKELAIAIMEVVAKYKNVINTQKIAKALASKNNLAASDIKSLESNLDVLKTQLDFERVIIDSYVPNFKTSPNGVISSVSVKFLEFFGYEREEVEAQNFSKFVANSSAVQKVMAESIRYKKAISTMTNFIKKDGFEVESELTIFPSFGIDGLANEYSFYLDLN
ncbi:response regulator [Arcobacter sp. FWKO B]|uniref:response regulator n=1 Tax=Arcobacter sp. FWKO B TaxID=2593672 RepID=UPI0018A38819|nr:response regulator [Arcobacter sp. FWKO B]QOG12883.1 response regulator [Arcobacter sp. FWKO B]